VAPEPSKADDFSMRGPVAVIGGGIGGLTTALALVAHGIDVTVHERAEELREIGAGLGLWPAPQAVYDRLGIGDKVRELAGPWKTAGLRRSDGRYIVRIPVEDLRARLGGVTIGVHRGELQALLLASLPDGVVRTGQDLIDLEQHGGSVTVTFADGTSTTARAVVGADGLRSRTRELLFGARRLHRCRMTGWRGTASPGDDDWSEYAGETWGPTGRFGVLPIAGRVTWYAAVRRFIGADDKDELLRRFGDWHDPIPDLIAATEPDQIWRDQVHDIRPLRRWSKERVTLLGDAAHAMTPDLGQGACQAILDAWALAEALATHADVQRALEAYERARKGRARMVAMIARAVTNGASEGRAAVAVRTALTQRVPVGAALRALAFVAHA
jgi:2-polyprenyl-6-methoxyphenol hydroxylase-like FAD-dependent oxidoreductase